MDGIDLSSSIGVAAPAAQSGVAEGQLPVEQQRQSVSYSEYLQSLRAAWPDLPSLSITYEQLALEMMVPMRKHAGISNMGTFFRDALSSINVFRDRSKDQQLFRPLHPCSGVVRPGEMTLVLAPPGHGKSALLKSLAGRSQREGKMLKGNIRWNGLTADEAKRAGLQLAKLAVYVDQGDVSCTRESALPCRISPSWFPHSSRVLTALRVVAFSGPLPQPDCS